MNVRKQPLYPFLHYLFGFLVKKFRNLRFQALSSIWKWIISMLSKLCGWRKTEVKDDRNKKTAKEGNSVAPKSIETRSDVRSREAAEDSNHSAHESTSLTNIACSIYPYASDGNSDASHSYSNLVVSRSAHGDGRLRRFSQSTPSFNGQTFADPTTQPIPPIDIGRASEPLAVTEQLACNPSSHNRNAVPEQIAIEMLPVASESPPEINLNKPSANISLPSVGSSSSSSSQVNSSGLSSLFSANSGNLRTIYLGHDNIMPVMPETTGRYWGRPRIKNEVKEVILPPLTTEYNKPLPPSGWTRFVHPEGARYFSKESAIGINSIWSESNILDNGILEKLEDDIITIERFISDNGVLIPTQSDLVVNVSDGTTIYYFANHPTRTIFFLDDYRLENMVVWGEIPGAESLCHIRYAIEAQYWYFILLFPHALDITKPIVEDLRGTILHFIGDSTTSTTSTAPYSLDDLYRVLTLIDHLDEDAKSNNEGAVSMLGRFMFIFANHRFYNFYGEGHSRLELTFSVYGDAIYARKWFITILGPLLFFASNMHLKRMQQFGVDHVIHSSRYKDVIKQARNDWQQFILLATVILNADVAFLAIQSVDTTVNGRRSLIQIFSYLSILCSIGSIVSGLFVTGEFQADYNEPENLFPLGKHMSRMLWSKLYMEYLAVLFSLPYALLMWGMIFFLVAFAVLCFQSSDLITRSVIGSFSFLIFIMVAWIVRMTWKPEPRAFHPE